MSTRKKWFQPYESCPERLPYRGIALAWLGAALATAAFASAHFALHETLILGSFGASCLLVFAYPQSPFAQPRNVIGGHFAATLTGLVFLAAFGATWWAMALAVGTAVALMLLLRIPHPPAGSNPLIVMMAGSCWDFLFTPTLAGSVILVAVALVYNNLGGRRYPTYWW
ncbi:HPP family protein [Neisseria sp. CCUG12390]|uniref:HPP family protein n=1 Tax=Neisseria sp. CCUG12390 TaxID=3392035 RepID=UPI003A0FFCE0